MVEKVHYGSLDKEFAIGGEYIRIGTLVLYSRIEPDVNPGETAKKIGMELKDKLFTLLELGFLDEIEPALYAGLIRGEV
jgi:hypothetical protein